MILWLATAQALTLDEAREEAARAAIAVERAEAQRTMAKAGAREAFGANLPGVTGFGSASTGQGFTSFGFERPVTNQFGAGLEGRWVLLAPAQWAAAASARQGANGAASMLQWARVDARREATVRYAAAWAAQQAEQARARAATDAGRAADAVQALVDAEIKPGADAARARADAATATAEHETALWTSRATCASLLALLRQDPDGTCDLEAPQWHAPEDGPPSHPALDAAQAALRGASADRTAAIAGMAPTVTATGNLAWYATDDASGPGWSAGVRGEVPVFGGGQGAARIQSTGAARDVAALALEEQERALRVALASNTARHQAALSALKARESALQASEEALSLVEQRYDAGTAELTAWMDARRTRDAAAVALAGAKAEVGTALAELEAARGVP